MGMPVSGDCVDSTQVDSLPAFWPRDAPDPAAFAARGRALPSSSVPQPSPSPPEGPAGFAQFLFLPYSFLITVDLTLAEC